jgi:hypothetical protein
VRCLRLVATVALLAVPFSTGAVTPAAPGRNLILITLDGVRQEEVFGGLDRAVLQKESGKVPAETTPTYQRYYAATPEARRARVMPFFWDTWIAAHGSIAGNRARHSRFGITNHLRFSYPGYAEILTGAPHDAVIDSNDNRRNPYPTVLEFLKDRLGLRREQVAVFGSWETFRWIVEHTEGALTVNAGYQPWLAEPAEMRNIAAPQSETLSPWDSVRFDYYTFRLAMAYLKTARPRVLYVAFGETDDWAHDHRYDRVLQTLQRTDGYFRELWTWLQQDPAYRDNTAIIITVDHGRGHSPADWFGHGKDVDGAQETWMAAVGPDWPRRGEWADAPDAFTNQIAATLAKAAGEDYAAASPDAGKPIAYLWGQ